MGIRKHYGSIRKAAVIGIQKLGTVIAKEWGVR